MARAQFRQNSTASDGLSLLAVALSSLLWIVPSLAASTHGHQTHATHPKSVFALEHQVGKPGAQFAATMTLSCGPNAVKGNLLISVTEKVINDAELTVSGIMPPPATPAISSTWINSEEAVAIGLLREERSCKFAASLFLICSENIKGYNLSLNDPLSTSL